VQAYPNIRLVSARADITAFEVLKRQATER